jgi:type II secretory pathway pseudopilin PulG
MSKNRLTTLPANGFSLIEVIVYVALLSLILAGFVSVAWNLIYSQVKADTQQELNYQLRSASQRIGFEIRNASAINSITSTSVSLAQTEAGRNPTVIDFTGGRIRIGWGSSGACPTTSPCYLTGGPVTISAFSFTNLTSGVSANVSYTFTGTTTGSSSEHQGTQTIQSAAELQTD